MAAEKEKQLRIVKFLSIATIAAIVVNFLILLMQLSLDTTFFDTIQFLWPLLSIILLINIYISTGDRNIKNISFFMAIALIPWTITILLWEVILPLFFYNELAYYVTGFGFLLAYLILIYFLYGLKNSKQWYIHPSTNNFINIIGVISAIAITIFILINLKLDSPRILDILILFGYLICDVFILVLCSKLLNMNLIFELKYLIYVITEFVFINSIADLFFEARWLISLKAVYTVKVSLLTDVIYTISLITMAIALLIFTTSIKNKAIDEIRKDLKDRELFADNLIMHSPEAMGVFDTKGNIILANDPFLKVFEVNRGNIIGKFNMFEHMVKMDPATREQFDKVKNGEKVNIPRLEYNINNNGIKKFISLKIFPTYDSFGKLMSYVSVVTDITEKLKTQEELLESKKQNELYLDLMGHDINNMNQMGIGYLELAGDILDTRGSLNNDDRIFLEKSLDAFKNSSRLINNVRMAQNIRKEKIIKEKVDIGVILEELNKDYKNIKSRDISIYYTPVKGANVYANSLLKEVFSNLIGNSIKHSSQDVPLNIDIMVDKVVKDNKGYYKISIEDNGPGIPDDRKDNIFERYKDCESKTKGLGLGLYLTKTLIDGYEGKIWVEDAIKGDHTKGCRFVIMLPEA
jgi:PAS domain S-box-containing protein